MTDLTFSQLTTLRLLAEGKSPREIAEVMQYTVNEVDNEIARDGDERRLYGLLDVSPSMGSDEGSRSVSLGSQVSFEYASGTLSGSAGTAHLTRTEGDLLAYLAGNTGLVVSARELMDKVWEYPPGTGTSDVVRSHMRNLRRKLREIAPEVDFIKTFARRGYRFRAH
jgi:DNA-binding response OmpR family regulator